MFPGMRSVAPAEHAKNIHNLLSLLPSMPLGSVQYLRHFCSTISQFFYNHIRYTTTSTFACINASEYTYHHPHCQSSVYSALASLPVPLIIIVTRSHFHSTVLQLQSIACVTQPATVVCVSTECLTIVRPWTTTTQIRYNQAKRVTSDHQQSLGHSTTPA